MKSMDKVLQIVGNENRRKILTLLSKEPHYISQIAKKLDVTQPAILKHLSILERAGLIESFWRKSSLGAARKYYKICDSVGIEIAINPKDFRVARRPQKMSCPRYLEMEKVMKQLTEEINRAEDAALKVAKAQKLSEMADVLLSCEDYDGGNWSCENCRRIASLRKEASQIILHVSRGDIELGLRRLTRTINQLVSGLLPSSKH
ncbi:MAG: ArsR family transcriptional regulator [Candidatus Bathyarchaeia archaeon]|nr:ArsR family transcriptional regulator [Candidatus Bathyarchaeia archaeon]